MNKYDTKSRALAICLSALAGYVDAVGFIASGGFFVSFMSGNSTRLAVGMVDNNVNAVVAAGLIGTFVVGVFGGSIVGHLAAERRRFALLILISTMLALAAYCDGRGDVWPAIFILAFTMGSENAVFERGGETRVGLTYMTGSLVRIGHGFAGFVIGQKRPGFGPYVVLWLGLTSGAVGGAIAYSHLHAISIWIASGAAATLAIMVRTVRDVPL
jgi:uncharacterized membrane protein YoaK (UPF0700 family)